MHVPTVCLADLYVWKARLGCGRVLLGLPESHCVPGTVGYACWLYSSNPCLRLRESLDLHAGILNLCYFFEVYTFLRQCDMPRAVPTFFKAYLTYSPVGAPALSPSLDGEKSVRGTERSLARSLYDDEGNISSLGPFFFSAHSHTVLVRL